MVQGFGWPLVRLVVIIVLLDSGWGSSKCDDGRDVVSNVIWLVKLRSNKLGVNIL